MKVAKYISVVLVIVASALFSKSTAFSQFKEASAISWKGIASYYHQKFNGRKTSTGEVFSNSKLTCANNFLKLGSYIKVTNLVNGNCVIVKVNDRMNPRNKRLIDLSQEAAKQLGLLDKGVGQVEIELIDSTENEIAFR